MNGKGHKIVGSVAGGGLALYLAREEPTAGAVALETIGGIVGGILGGALPDILEPASLGPRHRGRFHSAAALGAGTTLAAQGLFKVQANLRARADARRVLAAQAPTALGAFWNELLAILFRLLAGGVAGLSAGYGSHLVVDALTPASLPVI